MSEFPERTWLWRDQYHYLNTSPSKVGNKVSVEYVRADLYDTVTAERDAALARAERAEKALDQAIRRANLYAENELEDSDLRAAKHEVNQMLVVWNSRDDYKDLNAYLRARENQ